MGRPLLGLLPQVSKDFLTTHEARIYYMFSMNETIQLWVFFLLQKPHIYSMFGQCLQMANLIAKCSKDLRCSPADSESSRKQKTHVWYWRKIAKLCLIPKKVSPKLSKVGRIQVQRRVYRIFHIPCSANCIVECCRMIQKKTIQNGWKSARCQCPKVDPNPSVSM